jgi:hypothetical protein
LALDPKRPKLLLKFFPAAVDAPVCPPNKLGTLASEPIEAAASAKRLALVVSEQVRIWGGLN